VSALGKTRTVEFPLPLRGRREITTLLPRVALRPRRRGLRSTRGYMPGPLRGRMRPPAAYTLMVNCLSALTPPGSCPNHARPD
jgi:hypothetical protein